MPDVVIYERRVRTCRRYGGWLPSLIGDAFLTAVTGGLWLIWVLIRELSK